MHPEIIHTSSKHLAGLSLTMSLAQNRTQELWASFMALRKTYPEAANALLYSIQMYDDHYFSPFSPSKTFEKWAAIEINAYDQIPPGMKGLILPEGVYAVFHYTGSSKDPSIFQYIYGTWLPSSGYVLDHRPHFEVLGPRYRNDHPESEEDIWIPVKPRPH